eukprot:GDKK01012207.1.p1 GENE.GDKK01012207.1~~GDKK01012207.1.p1  ORF type:complete len:128 (-),score=11.61 GDKK01012207.1:256-639(-)
MDHFLGNIGILGVSSNQDFFIFCFSFMRKYSLEKKISYKVKAMYFVHQIQRSSNSSSPTLILNIFFIFLLHDEKYCSFYFKFISSEKKKIFIVRGVETKDVFFIFKTPQKLFLFFFQTIINNYSTSF